MKQQANCSIQVGLISSIKTSDCAAYSQTGLDFWQGESLSKLREDRKELGLKETMTIWAALQLIAHFLQLQKIDSLI